MRPPPGLRRWGMFMLVGMGGFAVQIAILSVLTRVWAWHSVPAAAVAMETAIVQNYFAHSRWTWADRRTQSPEARLWRPLRYQCAKTITLGLNVGLTAAFVTYGGLPPEVATAIAVGACAVVNYAASDRLVFADAARSSRRVHS